MYCAAQLVWRQAKKYYRSKHKARVRPYNTSNQGSYHQTKNTVHMAGNQRLCQFLPQSQFYNASDDTHNDELISGQACMVYDQVLAYRRAMSDSVFPKFSFNGMAACMYIEKVYDGDTIHGLFFCGEKIMMFPLRMMGYDSPEMKPELMKKVENMRTAGVLMVDTLSKEELREVVKNEKAEEQLLAMKEEAKSGRVTKDFQKKLNRLEGMVQVQRAIYKEKAAALEARNRLMEMCFKKIVYVEFHDFDKYGRLLATVYPLRHTESTRPVTRNIISRGTKSLNAIMVEEGYGVPYNGGTKTAFM